MPDAGACGGSLGVIELLAEFNTAPTLNGSVPVIATALQSTIAFLSVTAGPATRIAWPLIGGVVAVGFGAAAAWLTARAGTAATVGPFLRRESLLLDRPIKRLAFATAKDDVKQRVSRIVLHVRDE
jgi:hypothetical protein